MEMWIFQMYGSNAGTGMRVCNNLPQPPPNISFLGACGRLLRALNPHHSAFLYQQFLAQCHPYFIFNYTKSCIYTDHAAWLAGPSLYQHGVITTSHLIFTLVSLIFPCQKHGHDMHTRTCYVRPLKILAENID